MSIKKLLQNTDHRPWPLPEEKWKYYQEWNRTVFLHWQVDLSDLKAFVHPSIEIDLFDGQPWVSLVAFTMEKVRPRYLPVFPPVSNFHEVNIRTYVKSKDKTGVYFLSIEAGTRISSKIAGAISELPYRFSPMKRRKNSYLSSNSQKNDRFEINYEIGSPIQKKTNLDQWLTERYALIQDSNNSIIEFDIHHAEWPLNELKLHKLSYTYPLYQSFLHSDPDLKHYSPGVQVVAWKKQKHVLNQNI